MNYLKIYMLIALFSMFQIISCREPVPPLCRIDYKIPDHISIKGADLKVVLEDFKTDPAADCHMEIVLYSYSSGTERVSFSGEGDVKTVTGKGKLKALVKIMNGKKIIRADFVESEGKTKEEMISSLVHNIRLQMGRVSCSIQESL